MTEPQPEAGRAPVIDDYYPDAPHGLQHHDIGCQCWPHVGQREAVAAVEAVALAEYREGVRGRAEAAGSLAALRSALAGLLWLVENNPNTTVSQIIDTEPVAAARAILADEGLHAAAETHDAEVREEVEARMVRKWDDERYALQEIAKAVVTFADAPYEARVRDPNGAAVHWLTTVEACRNLLSDPDRTVSAAALAHDAEVRAAERERVLARLYCEPGLSVLVAKLCDEEFDRSGALLGRIRERTNYGRAAERKP